MNADNKKMIHPPWDSLGVDLDEGVKFLSDILDSWLSTKDTTKWLEDFCHITQGVY